MCALGHRLLLTSTPRSRASGTTGNVQLQFVNSATYDVVQTKVNRIRHRLDIR